MTANNEALIKELDFIGLTAPLPSSQLQTLMEVREVIAMQLTKRPARECLSCKHCQGTGSLNGIDLDCTSCDVAMILAHHGKGPAAREALSSRPEGEAVAIPKGWAIERDGDWVSVAAPDGIGVKVRHPTGTEQSVNDSATLLVKLADALLSAPPAAAEGVPADSVALAACRAVVEWCDKNPPAGSALWCVNLCRFAIAKAPAFSPVAEYEDALRGWQAEFEYVESGNRILKDRVRELESELARLRTQSAASEHSLAMVGAQAGIAWSEQDALSALSFDSDGPFGQSDVEEMLRFLAHIDMMRDQKIGASRVVGAQAGVVPADEAFAIGMRWKTALSHASDARDVARTMTAAYWPALIRGAAITPALTLSKEEAIVFAKAEVMRLLAAPIVDANKGGVPEGFKLVPLKATDHRQQHDTAFNLCSEFGEEFTRKNRDFALRAYEWFVHFAPAAPVAADERVQEWLMPADLEQLVRFHGYVSDPDSDGYMNGKEAMKRLAELGCVKWCGGSRYEVTRFGEWIVETYSSNSPAELPLITCADFNQRSHQEMLDRQADAARKVDGKGGES